MDARHMKYVPGRKYVPVRKSDVQDCQWLQRLISQGYLRAAFRPAEQVCVVRAVARQREVLVAEQARWIQRMQKALVQMNIQLTEVLTDVMGTTGQAIIRAIVAGERDATVLARYRHSWVKASEREIAKALTGNWRDEHLFVLGQALSMYDDIARHLGECDAKLQGLLGDLGTDPIDLGKPPRAGSRLSTEFDARQILANWAGVDLTRINGLGLAAAMKIRSEIGLDLGRFANAKRSCSWLGLCPGNAFYRRLCSRIDKPRAKTATAHKLACMVYFMLTPGEDFVDQGQRSIAALRRRATALSFHLNPAPLAA